VTALIRLKGSVRAINSSSRLRRSPSLSAVRPLPGALEQSESSGISPGIGASENTAIIIPPFRRKIPRRSNRRGARARSRTSRRGLTRGLSATQSRHGSPYTLGRCSELNAMLSAFSDGFPTRSFTESADFRSRRVRFLRGCRAIFRRRNFRWKNRDEELACRSSFADRVSEGGATIIRFLRRLEFARDKSRPDENSSRTDPSSRERKCRGSPIIADTDTATRSCFTFSGDSALGPLADKLRRAATLNAGSSSFRPWPCFMFLFRLDSARILADTRGRTSTCLDIFSWTLESRFAIPPIRQNHSE